MIPSTVTDDIKEVSESLDELISAIAKASKDNQDIYSVPDAREKLLLKIRSKFESYEAKFKAAESFHSIVAWFKDLDRAVLASLAGATENKEEHDYGP